VNLPFSTVVATLKTVVDALAPLQPRFNVPV